MLIALLLILGVNLVVIVALVAAVVARQHWVRHQAGAFRGAIRVADGEIGGLGPTWSRGYGRWVRDVLVWNKAPFLFRTKILGADELAADRAADPGEVKRLGDNPAVVRLISGEHTIELATHGHQRELLRGPFGRSADVDVDPTTRPG